MDTENFYDLHPNPKNPRKISEQDFEALKRSIQIFGDLGSVIRNQRTGHLVGGHMRRNAFEKMGGEKRVVITHRFDTPNKQGTVAIGHIEHDGEMYGYRVVDWDEATETSASLAANKISGEWDDDLLEQQIYDLSQLENGDDLLGLSGFDEDEIAKLLNDSGAIDLEQEKPAKADDGMKRLTAKFTDDQFSTLYEAIAIMKRNRTLTQEQNTDLDANALYYICKSYVENTTSQNDAQTQETIETPTAGQTTTQPESAQIQTNKPYLDSNATYTFGTTAGETITTQPTPSANDLTSIPTDQPIQTQQ